MVMLLWGSLSLMTLAIWPLFHQGYFVPKLLVLATSGLICSVTLLHRREIQIPRLGTLGIGWLMLLTTSICALMRSPENPSTPLLISATFLFLLTLQLLEQENRSLRHGLLLSAGLSALILLTQTGFPSVWESLKIGFVRQRSSALVGNREFLATFMGLALLLNFPVLNGARGKRAFLEKTSAALCLGALVLIKSKGTLLIVLTAWIYPFLGKLKLRHWSALALTFLSIAVYTHSIRSRLFLWLIAGTIGISHLPLGAGSGGFGRSYVDAITLLFERSPWLRKFFGDLPGFVDDAHNIVLHSFAENGIVGLGIAFLILFALYQLLRVPGTEKGVIGLIFSKLLYTLILPSPISIAASAVSLALVFPREKLRNFEFNNSSRIIGLAMSAFSLFAAGNLLISESLYSEGYRKLGLGEIAQAESAFQQLTVRAPFRADTWLGLAYSAIQSRPTHDPDPFLIRALETGSDFNTLKVAAKIYLLAGDCYHASAIYSKLHLAYPEHLTSLSGLASCALAMNDQEKATFYAQRLLATQPRVPTRTYGLNLLTAEKILEKL